MSSLLFEKGNTEGKEATREECLLMNQAACPVKLLIKELTRTFPFGLDKQEVLQVILNCYG